MERVSATVALEWAASMGGRWKSTQPLEGLNDQSEPEAIRAAVIGTIEQTAVGMALEAPEYGDDACGDPDRIQEWLEWCVDQVSEPYRATPRERTFPALSTRPVSQDRYRPMRRWQGAARLQVQEVGIRWVRGRTDGRFAVWVQPSKEGGNVIEDGWGSSEPEMERKIVEVVSTALHQRSVWAGKEPPDPPTFLRIIADEARNSREDPALQSPAWLLRETRGA